MLFCIDTQEANKLKQFTTLFHPFKKSPKLSWLLTTRNQPDCIKRSKYKFQHKLHTRQSCSVVWFAVNNRQISLAAFCYNLYYLWADFTCTFSFTLHTGWVLITSKSWSSIPLAMNANNMAKTSTWKSMLKLYGTTGKKSWSVYERSLCDNLFS